ncbi:hypothetical protein ACFX2G_006135 [Malus domestica]
MYFGCHRPNIYNNAIRFGLNIYISATDHNLGFLGLLVLGPKWASVVTIEWVKALNVKCLFYPIYILNPTHRIGNCVGILVILRFGRVVVLPRVREEIEGASRRRHHLEQKINTRHCSSAIVSGDPFKSSIETGGFDMEEKLQEVMILLHLSTTVLQLIQTFR